MKMLYRGEEVEVIEQDNFGKVRVRYANEDESNWFKATDLKDIKIRKVSLGTRLLADIHTTLDALDPLTEDETPLFSELLTRFDIVESVRVLAPARLEDDARNLFDRFGISYPLDWRGTERGKRKADAQEQRSLAAVVILKDGRHFNNLGLTLRLLSEGKEFGWVVTKTA
jgi:hypothetical protein